MGQDYPGHLITFEGGEGVGKTTQQELLARTLRKQGYACVTTREPGGTEVGQALRHLLLESFPAGLTPRTELLLFAADRAEHVEAVIRPALAAGKIVLCDRFIDSTVVYQGQGRDVAREVIEQVNGIATQGLEPDLTFWLNLPPEIGLARVQQRRGQADPDMMESQNLAFHLRLQEGFAALATAYPERICTVDAQQPISDIALDIEKIVLGYLANAACDRTNDAC